VHEEVERIPIMTPSPWLEGARPQLEAICRAWRVPGLIVCAQRAGEGAALLAFGADAAGVPLSGDSLYPVASITKLATAYALLVVVAEGRVDLDAPLADSLPDAAMAQPGVTWRRLLCHAAGAPIDVDARLAPYGPGLTWSRLAHAVLQTPPLLPPGKQILYSNIGAGLAAILIERKTGLHFAAALRQLLPAQVGPFWLGVEPPERPAVIGGGRAAHAGTPLEPLNSPFWRSLALPWGGMVTTAATALQILQLFEPAAPQSRLPAALCSAAVTDQAGGLAGGFAGWMEWAPAPWGLGPEVRDAKQPHYAGSSASPASWGHLGGTGSLVWNDPEAGLAWSFCGPLAADRWVGGLAAVSDALLAAAAR
jgi:beta-lactamase class C